MEDTIITNKLPRDVEPYAVIRRLPSTPLFHPFFVDFGWDKISFYRDLYKDSKLFVRILLLDYDISLVPLVFGINIPHKR